MTRFEPEVFFSIEWNITTKCNNRCKHCYMYDKSTFEHEQKDTLDFNGLIKILNSIEDFEKKYNCFIKQFDIAGGDPLLRDDWFDFFKELKKRNREITLLANPENISNENIAKLSKLNIKHVQMSLDGLEKTHDYFRNKGSFQRTIEKLELLNQHGIEGSIKYSLFPTNSADLIPLMWFLARNSKTKYFSFDIGCYFGNGKNLEKGFSDKDIYKLLCEYLEEKENIKKEGHSIIFRENNNNFIKVAKFLKGKFHPITSSSGPVISGCYIGWAPSPILSDGTILACRKMPLTVGKMPEESFESIFLGSELLRKFRRAAFFKECKNCSFYSTCRGCPALVNSLTGDPFEKHPYCFKNSIGQKSINTNLFPKDLSMDVSFQEEWDLIKTRQLFKQFDVEMIKSSLFRKIYLALVEDEDFKSNFLADPFTFLKLKKIEIDNDWISWLVFIFGEECFYPHEQDIITDQIKLKEIEEAFAIQW